MNITDAHNLLTSENATATALIEARALVKDQLRTLEAEPKVAPGSGTTREQVAAIRQAQAEREESIDTLTDLHDRLHKAVQQRLAADALDRGREIAGQIEAGLAAAEEARQAYRAQVDDLASLGWELAECKRLAPELGLGGGIVRRIMAMEPVPSQHAMRFERGVKG